MKQAPKRRPLLVDRFLATPDRDLPLFQLAHGEHRGLVVQDLRRGEPKVKSIVPKLKEQLLIAKRYVFDDEATRYLGEVIRDCPEVIAYAQEFAIPPFPKLWIELNGKLLYNTIHGHPSAQPLHPKIDDSTDDVIGYFYLGPNVYGFAGVSDLTQPPGLSPLYYRLNQPWNTAEEERFCRQMGISRTGVDAFFWGSASSKFIDLPSHVQDMVRDGAAVDVPADTPMLDSQAFRMLRANHSVKLIEGTNLDLALAERSLGSAAQQAVCDDLLKGSSGDLRNIIALLLVLNRTSDITYLTEVAPVTQMLRFQPRAFVRHSVVRFKLNPVPRLKKILLGAGHAWRRLHDVRGHFCLNKRAREGELATCLLALHDWSEYDVNQWRCLKCGGLKWWRKAHLRGRLEKGFVDTTYEVTE